MRIISGFKDYYDYLAHESVDNKIVYNRHCQEFRLPDQEPVEFVGNNDLDVSRELVFPANYYDADSLHFCGECHHFMVVNGYVTYDIGEMYDLMVARARQEGRTLYAFRDRQSFESTYREKASTLNQTLHAPVVLQFKSDGRLRYVTNISLKSIDFVKLYPPEQAFMKIYDFLIPKEITSDSNPDNMLRYEAKGFDKKISFRKRK